MKINKFLIFVLVFIPVYGVIGTIVGINDRNYYSMISGLVCLAITFLLLLIVFVVVHKNKPKAYFTSRFSKVKELSNKYFDFVSPYLEKIEVLDSKFFTGSSYTSNILVSKYWNKVPVLLQKIFRYDGFHFEIHYALIPTEEKINRLVLSLVDNLIKDINLNNRWTDKNTLPCLIYFIIRNAIIIRYPFCGAIPKGNSNYKLEAKSNTEQQEIINVKELVVQDSEQSEENLGKELIIETDIRTYEEKEIEKAQQEAEQLRLNQEVKRQTQKESEWFLEQQRKEREEQERRDQEKQEREQKSKEFNERKFSLVKKYQDIVYNFIKKLTENYPYLFLKMFKDTDIPMSSILVKPYYGKSRQTETKIFFDGLKFTEAVDSNMNEKIQELTNFFIQGLKKRIKDNCDYDDEFTFPVLLYYIVRNNVIKYYRNEYIETYGYESLDEFCDHILNPFEQEKTNFKVLDDMLTISRYMSNNAITEYVYYYIYENNIDLPFVDTYKKIVLDMKQIFERKKMEKLEDDLFGKSKKGTVAVNDTPHTLSPIDRIDRMTGEQFEIFMTNYFENQGFKTTHTPLSGDYGIDLIIENDYGKIGVQAKCYSNKVSLDAVQQVVAGLRHYGLSSGIVITNNYFQKSAIRLAADNNITLWDRDKLIEKLGT